MSGLWHRLQFGLKLLMAAILYFMMVLTAADVISRYVLNAPISGAFEVVQYLMGILVFAGLPVTTASDNHLSVSLIPKDLSGLKGRIHRSFVCCVSAVGLLLIASRMAEQARILYTSKEVSGYLELPLAPIAAVMAVFATLAFLISGVQLVNAVIGRRDVVAEATVGHQG